MLEILLFEFLKCKFWLSWMLNAGWEITRTVPEEISEEAYCRSWVEPRRCVGWAIWALRPFHDFFEGIADVQCLMKLCTYVICLFSSGIYKLFCSLGQWSWKRQCKGLQIHFVSVSRWYNSCDVGLWSLSFLISMLVQWLCTSRLFGTYKLSRVAEADGSPAMFTQHAWRRYRVCLIVDIF